MKVEVKETSKTEWEFTADFGSDELIEAKRRVLEEHARDTKIAGFRQGKAPLNLVEAQINPMTLAQEVANLLAREQFLPDIESRVLMIGNSANGLEVIKFVPWQDMSLKFAAVVVPKTKLPDWKKLKLKRELKEPTEAEIEAEIAKILKSRANPKLVKRPAEKGDIAVVDFVGKKDGEAFENGSGKNYQLELGSNTFIEGFEDGVIGHKAGDEFELNLTFPKTYFEPSLAGAEVTFEVKLGKVLQPEAPELTDTVAKSFGASSVDDFKAMIKHHLSEAAHKEADKKLIDDFLMAMDKKVKLELADSLIEQSYEQFMAGARENLERQGLTLEGVAQMRGWSDKEADLHYHEDSLKALRSQLILMQLSEDLGFQADDNEVQANYQFLLAQHAGHNHDQKMPKKLDKKSRLWEDLARQIVLNRTYAAILKEYGA